MEEQTKEFKFQEGDLEACSTLIATEQSSYQSIDFFNGKTRQTDLNGKILTLNKSSVPSKTEIAQPQKPLVACSEEECVAASQYRFDIVTKMMSSIKEIKIQEGDLEACSTLNAVEQSSYQSKDSQTEITLASQNDYVQLPDESLDWPIGENTPSCEWKPLVMTAPIVSDLTKNTQRVKTFRCKALYDYQIEWERKHPGKTFYMQGRNIRRLAQAGFYYFGSQDRVVCHRCNLGLEEFEASDDPWVEHYKWNNTCAFISQCWNSIPAKYKKRFPGRVVIDSNNAYVADLTECGDVESNPGPTLNLRHKPSNSAMSYRVKSGSKVVWDETAMRRLQKFTEHLDRLSAKANSIAEKKARDQKHYSVPEMFSAITTGLVSGLSTTGSIAAGVYTGGRYLANKYENEIGECYSKVKEMSSFASSSAESVKEVLGYLVDLKNQICENDTIRQYAALTKTSLKIVLFLFVIHLTYSCFTRLVHYLCADAPFLVQMIGYVCGFSIADSVLKWIFSGPNALIDMSPVWGVNRKDYSTPEMYERVPTHDEDEEKESDGNGDFMYKLCIVCLCAITGKFAIESVTLEKLMKKVDVLSKGSNGFRNLFGMKTGPLEKAINWFRVALVGEDLTEIDIEIKQHVEQIVELHNRLGDKQISSDKNLVKKILDLNASHNKFLYSHQYKKFLSKSHIQDLNQVGALLFSLHKRAIESNAETGGSRQEPFFMMLSGQPGCGKSFALTHMVPFLLTLESGETVVNHENLTQYMYNRCVETEYWDNYCGQPVIVYDDYGQVKDTVGTPSAEMMEVIRVVNTAPMVIHSAAIEDKGRHFNGRFVIATTNQERNMRNIIQSVNDPVAVLRRIGSFAVRVKANPAYTRGSEDSTEYSRDVAKSQDVLDPAKMRNCKACHALPEGRRVPNFCTHAQFFTLYDIVTDEPITNFEGKHIGTDLVYGQFLRVVKMAYEGHRRKIESQKKFQDKVYSDPLCLMDESEFSEAEMYQVSLARQKTFDYNSKVRKEEIQLPSGSGTTETENVSVIPEDDKVLDMVDAFIGYNQQDLIQPVGLFGSLATKKFGDFELSKIFSNVQETFVEVSYNTYEKIKRYSSNFSNFISAGLCSSLDVECIIESGGKYLMPVVIYVNSLKYGLRQRISQGVNYLHYLANSTKDWLSSLNIVQRIKNLWERAVKFVKEHPIISAVGLIVGTLFMAFRGYNTLSNFFEKKHETEAVIPNSGETRRVNSRRVEGIVSNSSEAKRQVNRKVETSLVSNSSEAKRKVNRKVEVSSPMSNSGEPKKIVNRRVESLSGFKTKLIQLSKNISEQTIGERDLDDVLQKSKSPTSAKFVANADLSRLDVSAPEIVVDPTLEELQKKLMLRNQVMITCDGSPLTNGLFVRGTHLLLPKHLVEHAQCDASKLYTINSLQGENVGSFTARYLIENNVTLTREVDSTIFEGDVVLCYLDPRKTQAGVSRPDLVSAFVKQSDLGAINAGLDGDLFSLRRMDGSYTIPFLRGAKVTEVSVERVSYSNDMFTDKYISFRYVSQTQGGDCASPFLLDDTRFQNRRILGVHTSAFTKNTVKNGHVMNIGEGWIVTQEDLARAMERIDAPVSLVSEYEDFCVDDSYAEMIIFDDKIGSIKTNIGLEIIGKAPFALIQQTATKIIPSKLSETFNEEGYPKKMPASLRPVNGVDPMTLGTTKYSKRTPIIEDVLEICVQDACENFYMSVYSESPNPYQRLLTSTEMYEGNRDILVEPLNRSTSMGYPYAQEFRGTSGKRTAFGFDEWTYDNPLAQRIMSDVNRLEDLCERGIVKDVYWSDTLKDEKRPIEKVQAGKTRVFTAGPVHYTVLFRKYFGGFTGWMMRNHIHNEIAVGTNVYSDDWDQLARYLLRNKKPNEMSVIAGDFENYDGSENSQILWSILDCIDEWYRAGEYLRCKNEGRKVDLKELDRQTQVRKTLWSHIVNAVHVNGNTVYQCTHSIPSGCPMTAVLNSIYGSVIARLAYYYVAKEHAPEYATMESFRRFVRVVVYGDDNLISVHPEISKWLNQEHITQAFLKIGHVYTDEAKTGAVYASRSIEDVAFLKRRFVYSSLAHRWIAPVDMDTVLETALWTKSGCRADTITLDNCEFTLDELALHGQDVYKKYGRQLIQAANQVGYNLILPAWRERFSKVLHSTNYLF